MKWSGLIAQLAGYGFATVIGWVFIKNIVDTLLDCVAPNGSKNPQLRPEPWSPQALGAIEMILYVAFFQAGLGLLVGLWLLLKVVGLWKRWSEPADPKTQKPDGQVLFYVFLIGNGLAVLYAFFGYKMIGWLAAARVRGCWVPVLVIAWTFLLWSQLKKYRKPA